MHVVEHISLAALATLTVSIWTVRVALTASGRRHASALAAVVEAMLFVTIFSHVLDAVDSPTRLIAYGAGVGLGSLAGHRVDARFRTRGDGGGGRGSGDTAPARIESLQTLGTDVESVPTIRGDRHVA